VSYIVSMIDASRIEAEGMKLLQEFSEKLSSVPESEETHYVVDLRNVWRADGEPERCEGFKDNLKGLAPKFEDGYLVTEKGV
jgi:predicted Asp-tRNA(Asn)/Glu-tRNA(Gln) amidotransferase subunit C